MKDIPTSLTEYLTVLFECEKDWDTGYPKEICIDGKCKNSCNIIDERAKDYNWSKPVSYYQFVSVTETYFNKKGKQIHYKHISRKDKDVTLKEVYDLLLKDAKDYLMHRYNVLLDKVFWQQHLDQTNIPVVWMDYSQNIKLVEKKQVQSTHFSGRQHTLHDSLIQNGNEYMYIYHISDDTNHDSIMTNEIIMSIITNYPMIIASGHLQLHSDNCSTQYKSRFVFKNLLNITKTYHIHIDWFFGEPGHGRGLIDAMAWFGCKDGLMRKEIISNDAWFLNAQEMTLFLKNHLVESEIVLLVDYLTELKVPLDGFDIRRIVKTLLDSVRITNKIFNDNMPGVDWEYGFIKQHNLTKRIADNVRAKLAEVTPELVNAFFDELSVSLEGVLPENMYNYDETNLTDDPDSKTVIVRRGKNRIERKQEHSKQAISTMFCGSAAGKFLPCMVIYKAKNTYPEWIQGAPKGTIFDCSKKGWFDGRLFALWVFKVFVPSLEGPGPFALIGDNLGSHFSKEVVAKCKEMNILFITLVPNSTHLTQPLYVAVFRLLKSVWRRLLGEWRKESRQKGVLQKNHFPLLLQRLYNSLKGENIVSGFKACSIYPLDRKSVLKRITVTDEQ